MKINNQRIQLQNIKKKFGNDNVLNSVNLTVNSGEIVGLIAQENQQLSKFYWVWKKLTKVRL